MAKDTNWLNKLALSLQKKSMSALLFTIKILFNYSSLNTIHY